MLSKPSLSLPFGSEGKKENPTKLGGARAKLSGKL